MGSFSAGACESYVHGGARALVAFLPQVVIRGVVFTLASCGLGAHSRNILILLTPALLALGVLLGVVSVVLSVTMLAVTQSLWSDQLTVNPTLNSPAYIQSVLDALWHHLFLEFLILLGCEQLVAHFISHYLVILPVGINVIHSKIKLNT